MKTLVILFVCIAFYSSAGILKSCKKEAAKSSPVQPDTTNMPAIKYLALGDSYTIGQGVSQQERFPFLTTQLLRDGGIKIEDPKYLATTGWTTGNLLAALANQTPQKYDVVTLLIGVNDQYVGVDTAVYRTRFSLLLKKALEAVANKPSRVFVLSIPDYSATPFVAPNNKAQVSREIDEFNAINKQVTVQNNITYINITSLSREALNDRSLLAPDSLHYSGMEHQKWAQLLAPAIKAALQ